MTALQLHWQLSPTVSSLHAAWAWQQRWEVLDAPLAAALARPTEELLPALNEEHIQPSAFWSHAIPLAAGNRSLQEVAEVTLTKILGRDAAPVRLARFQGLLIDLKNTFSAVVLDDRPTLAAPMDSLRQRWNYHGANILSGVVAWTEPGVLVEEATVVCVQPCLGGCGIAHLPYNLARVEVLAQDPVPQLPEVLRLAWLVSMLNLDLPRYSEPIAPKYLGLVAGLAMIPVVLAAAEVAELAKCDAATLSLAVRTWLQPLEQQDAQRAPLDQWWDVYRTMRLPWPEALKALERLLEEADEPR